MKFILTSSSFLLLFGNILNGFTGIENNIIYVGGVFLLLLHGLFFPRILKKKSSYLPAISFLLFYLFFSLNTSAKIVPIEFFPKVLFLVALFFAFALNASILFINQILNAYKINGILASIVVLIMHVYSGFWNYRAPLALIFGYEQTKNYLFISLIIAISSAFSGRLFTRRNYFIFYFVVLYISLYASLGRNLFLMSRL